MPTSRLTSFAGPAAIAAALWCSCPLLHAQKAPRRSDPDGPGPKTGLTIALAVGAARYDFTGQGVCLQVPEGSIYGAPAVFYSVRQTSDRQRLNMTLYRLKKGADMLTMNVTLGKDTHSVSTVKTGETGVALGSGAATLEQIGKGGTLTIDAVDPKGVKITGTIKCDAFNLPGEGNGL